MREEGKKAVQPITLSKTLNYIHNISIPITSKDSKGHLCELYHGTIPRTLDKVKNCAGLNTEDDKGCPGVEFNPV